MPRKKTKTKARRPLTISIHGNGIDIEATFRDSQLSDVLAETIKRVSPTAAKTETPPLATLIGEFGKALRKDQLDLLMNTLDMNQKLMFMEIMNAASSEPANN